MRAHSVLTTTTAAMLLLGAGRVCAQPQTPSKPATAESADPAGDRDFLAREWDRFVSSGNAEREIAEALDRQMRQGLTSELARLGEKVDWRQHTWQELRDMQLRAEQARVLRDRFGLRLKWRSYPLLQMRDFQARIEKAAQLERQGVKVDWRNYTFEQLDEWVRYQARVRALVLGTPPPMGVAERDPDEVLEPSFFAVRPMDPADDPDAVLEPTFNERRPVRRVH